MMEGVPRSAKLIVLVAALGYFVDIYDLVLFSIVRVSSLRGLGVPEEQLLDRGVLLLNAQMAGMLFGGIAWGVLGDKRGRLSVLFGSIITYSLANIANGFVTSVETYAILRFVAGVGLAGELGAGITLVSEVMERKTRGYATTIVAGVGISGAVVAALIGDAFPWRTAYFVGGGLGLLLLALRVGVRESEHFARTKAAGVARGSFLQLLSRASALKRYGSVIVIGVPIWYVVGILVTFSPEIGRAMGMSEAPAAGRAIMFTYIGLAIGDFGSGALSQWMRSRKRALTLFVSLTALAVLAYFTLGRASLTAFYSACVALGVATGYWAVFVTVAAEQFGTNLRATATTTAPNFVRGAVVPLTFAFQALKDPLGVVGSAAAIGALTLVLALVCLGGIEETYGKDLDFHET